MIHASSCSNTVLQSEARGISRKLAHNLYAEHLRRHRHLYRSIRSYLIPAEKSSVRQTTTGSGRRQRQNITIPAAVFADTLGQSHGTTVTLFTRIARQVHLTSAAGLYVSPARLLDSMRHPYKRGMTTISTTHNHPSSRSQARQGSALLSYLHSVNTA
jgi:hypothetical protein